MDQVTPRKPLPMISVEEVMIMKAPGSLDLMKLRSFTAS